MTRAGITAAFFADDHFHLDFLQRELVVDQIQQLQRALIGHLIAAQFDPRRFTGEFGMRRHHFTIEEKRNIRVEFLLELMQPLVRVIPRPRLTHGENNFAVLFIHAEEIDHRRVRHAGRFLLLLLIVLLILRHWAE